MPLTARCCKATCRESAAVQPPDADADAAGYVTAAAADSPEPCHAMSIAEASADCAGSFPSTWATIQLRLQAFAPMPQMQQMVLVAVPVVRPSRK